MTNLREEERVGTHHVPCWVNGEEHETLGTCVTLLLGDREVARVEEVQAYAYRVQTSRKASYEPSGLVALGRWLQKWGEEFGERVCRDAEGT